MCKVETTPNGNRPRRPRNSTLGARHEEHPLEGTQVTLVETGAHLGSLDWSVAKIDRQSSEKREKMILEIVRAATKRVRKYLSTPFEKDATGTLRHPGRFRGSGSSSNLHADPPKKGKGKKGKKKK